MTNKECPMRVIGYIAHQDETELIGDEKYCVKEDCEWWDDKTNQCSIKTIATAFLACFSLLLKAKSKEATDDDSI